MCNGELLEAFEPTTRANDIFCATAAKSGQTWLLTLLHHLKTRGRDPDFGGVGLRAAAPWLELPMKIKTGDPYDTPTRLAQLEALEDPRIFKMHVLWNEIPRLAGSGAKVITISRDPRDLPYSMFRHIQGLKPDNRPPNFSGDFDEYFETWLEFGYVFKFGRSFWPHRADPDLLWLRFEDLKAQLAVETRKIVDFAGWELTDEDIDRALPLVDFTYMQENERAKLFINAKRSWADGHRFFREGGVGKNRAQLSADQEARIIARGREEFEPECFDFLFSQGV